MQWRIHDLPRGTYYFGHFFPENCLKKKWIGEGVRVPSAPLDGPLLCVSAVYDLIRFDLMHDLMWCMVPTSCLPELKNTSFLENSKCPYHHLLHMHHRCTAWPMWRVVTFLHLGLFAMWCMAQCAMWFSIPHDSIQKYHEVQISLSCEILLTNHQSEILHSLIFWLRMKKYFPQTVVSTID